MCLGCCAAREPGVEQARHGVVARTEGAANRAARCARPWAIRPTTRRASPSPHPHPPAAPAPHRLSRSSSCATTRSRNRRCSSGCRAAMSSNWQRAGRGHREGWAEQEGRVVVGGSEWGEGGAKGVGGSCSMRVLSCSARRQASILLSKTQHTPPPPRRMEGQVLGALLGEIPRRAAGTATACPEAAKAGSDAPSLRPRGRPPC